MIYHLHTSKGSSTVVQLHSLLGGETLENDAVHADEFFPRVHINIGVPTRCPIRAALFEQLLLETLPKTQSPIHAQPFEGSQSKEKGVLDAY